jgi:hypothetical protein
LGYNDASRRDGNYERLSGMVMLLPFVEQKPLYDQFTRPDPTGVPIPPGGPAPWSNQPNWANGQVELYMCPSDPAGAPPGPASRGTCNYAMCQGDRLLGNNNTTNNNNNATFVNGMFAARFTVGMRDILDGTSNTVGWGERVFGNFNVGAGTGLDARQGIVINVGTPMLPSACVAKWLTVVTGGRITNGAEVKGRFSRIWQDGQAEGVGFTTITAPNGASCINDGNTNADGAMVLGAASSYHPGGAQCALMDGKVTFVSENIDTGNLGVQANLNSKSPYGVWGALGTRAGGDTARAP